MLEIQNIYKTFNPGTVNEKLALNGVSLKLEEGDFVTFDFGAVYEGYHSDMTRTIVMGTASELQRKLYASVLKAQKKGVAAVHAGMTGKELDAVCRDSLTADGYGDKYTHGTGHGVGLEIHELPVASPRSTDTLEENMVVTVEPGINQETSVSSIYANPALQEYSSLPIIQPIAIP